MRGTTPTIAYTIPIDLGDIKNFTVTFRIDGEVVLKKKKDDCVIEDNKIIVELSQEDTLLLPRDKIVETQVKLLFMDGNVLKTKPKNLFSGDILDEEVIS